MREIQLTQGKVARVSDEDFERVRYYKWTAHKGSSSGSRWYAIRNESIFIEIAPGILERRRRWVRLHRFLMDLPPGSLDPTLVVDHLDGDGLNCERSNLEVITHDANRLRAAAKRKKNVECFL